MNRPRPPALGRGTRCVRAGIVAVAALTAVAGCTGTTDTAASTAQSATAADTAPETTAAPATADVDPDLGDAGTDGDDGTDDGTGGDDADAAVAEALALLETLPVKGRAPKTGYSRDQFGPAWTDAVSVAGGRNGCDTRNDILGRDLHVTEYRPGTRDCTVLTGLLDDPYTGERIDFTRGQDTSMAVQIDHVVALSDAWQKGAQQLDYATRQDFANDPRNLLAVSGPANQQKGDGDAATWLPANKAFRCTYVAMQIHVKADYSLWVTAAEREAMARVLGACSAPIALPAPLPEPGTPPAAPPVAEGEVYFPNCAAARAAGAAPIRIGEPGYRPELDGDRDGIACE